MTGYWLPFENGATLHTRGTEGVIVRDHHLPGEARMTLEKTSRGYALTVGIYGWMVHTFFCSENEAGRRYAEVQSAVRRIVDMVPLADEATDTAMRTVTDAIARFVEKY